MEELTYKVEKEGEATILILTVDNITMYQNEELQNTFTKLLDEGAKNIVLDLTRTKFISSVVIASLVFMLKRTKEAGGNLLLCGVKGKVEEVLSITNLNKVFDIFDDRQKAVGQFAKK